MGGGILPAAIHNNKLYFLFGKENKYADTPGWSDIGGGTDNGETFLQTACREGSEELTGFLGQEKDIRKLLTAHGTYNVDFGDKRPYRIHIFPYKYDPMLPVYYNNNHKFLERKLSENLIKTSKIFEKDEIRWIECNEMYRTRNKFRHYFRDVVKQIHAEHHDIKRFIRKASRKTSKKRTRRKSGPKTRRKKSTGKKTRKR